MNILKTPFLIFLCAALAAPSFLHAQKGKYLSKAAKKLEAEYARRAREAVSRGELLAREHRLMAVQEMRRALVRDPNFTMSPAFKTHLQTLREMGIQIPLYPPPGKNPTSPAGEVYYKYMRGETFKALSEEADRLAEDLDTAVFPLTLPRKNADWSRSLSESARMASKRDAFQHAKTTGNESFSWGTPGVDEIRMGPARLPDNPQDGLYGCRDTAVRLAQSRPKTLGQAFDFILYSRRLTPVQKNALLLHLAQISDFVGPDLVLNYMNTFRRLPAVMADGWMPAPLSPLLETYARNTQTALIEDLTAGRQWTEDETDAFLDVTAYIPPQTARDVLGALTYMEPKAALWLLQNPETSAVSRKIRAQLYAARQYARFVEKPGRTAFFERLETSGLQRRKTLLYVWSATLTDRLAEIQNRIGVMEYAQQCAQDQKKMQTKLDDHQLAQKLYVDVRLARLKKLRNLVHDRLEKVEAEINSISPLDAERAAGSMPLP